MVASFAADNRRCCEAEYYSQTRSSYAAGTHAAGYKVLVSPCSMKVGSSDAGCGRITKCTRQRLLRHSMPHLAREGYGQILRVDVFDFVLLADERIHGSGLDLLNPIRRVVLPICPIPEGKAP